MMKSEAWKNWESRTVDGKYPLRRWLGGSEHSAVFLTDKPGQASQKAAIKLIELNGLDPDREATRLRAAANLAHPHLMPILETGRCRLDGASLLYVVMEYAEEDLAQILPQRPLTPAEVGDLLPPLLDALSYVHEKGFVHGHIKPSNVLAVHDQLKLSTDRVTSEQTNPVRRRIGVFDAPETAAGVISPASDVWSLGVTIVDALTQHPPTEGPSNAATLDSIPEPFRGIARECLHLDPKRRSSLSEIRARLQPAGRSVPVEHQPLPSPPQVGNTRKILIAAALIIVAVLVLWGLFHQSKNKSSEQASDTSQPVTAPTGAPATAPAASRPTEPTNKTGASGEVTHQVLPDVPQSAKNTISGTIKISVRVDVDSSGKVTSAKLKSAGPSRYFAAKALQAAEDWQFAPPQVNGRPGASAWLLQFRFRRTGIQASPERLTR